MLSVLSSFTPSPGQGFKEPFGGFDAIFLASCLPTQLRPKCSFTLLLVLYSPMSSFNVSTLNTPSSKASGKSCFNSLSLSSVNVNEGLNSYRELITYVKDRPGHDLRYAIDAKKIKNELGWIPNENFDSGIKKTVLWYLKNKRWSENVQNGSYKLQRLGEI